MNRPNFSILGRALIAALLATTIALPAMAQSEGPDPLAFQQDFSQIGPHMAMGHHMVMTDLRTPATPADVARARHILAVLRVALVKYKDWHVAVDEGDVIFLPSVPQDVYHFTNYPASTREDHGVVELNDPGSLLYVRDGDGYRLVGAMYSAPAGASAAQLNAIVPLSIASWHVHTNICLPDGITLADMLRNNIGIGRADVPGLLPVADGPRARAANQIYGFMADGRFGFTGTIYTASACQAAQGHFISQAFSWMVHVYPFAGDNLKVDFAHDPPKTESGSPLAMR